MSTEADNDVDLAKKALKSKRRIGSNQIKANEWLSTGSTLLNLACGDHPLRGFGKGKYYFFVGDSSSGKTFLTLTCLAEAANNPNFDDYRFIHDNPEDGALMNISQYFGKKVARRLEAPRKDGDGAPRNSETIEDFYYNIDDALKDGRPFIYVLDSMDALTSNDDVKKFEKGKAASRKAGGDKVAGSYGDGKAKINSQHLRRVSSQLKRTGSILIIISQTRDNIGMDAMFNPKSRAGGRALKFYAALEIWTSVRKELKRKVKEKDRAIGILVQCKIKKNRQSGKNRSVMIPLYHSVGIDDIGGCIDYLVEEGHWKTTSGRISAPEYDVKLGRDKLIEHIEESNLESDLRDLVGMVWREIEAALAVKRKARY